MTNRSIWVKDRKDLSNNYGANFFEFQTGSIDGFNMSMLEICQKFIHASVTQGVNFQGECQEEIARQLRANSAKVNFLFSPENHIGDLRCLVQDCLSHYLGAFEKEY